MALYFAHIQTLQCMQITEDGNLSLADVQVIEDQLFERRQPLEVLRQ